MAVQSKNRLCSRCHRELTDKEMASNQQVCWFCLAAFLKQVGESDKIPDPASFGHPNGKIELETIEKTEQLKKLSMTSPEQPEKESVVISEEDRKHMMTQFGIDPLAPQPVTIITVKGKNDDTYLQFSTRGTISADMKKQIERWLKTQFDVIGTVISFGPNYGATLLQMKMLTGMEFLKDQ